MISEVTYKTYSTKIDEQTGVTQIAKINIGNKFELKSATTEVSIFVPKKVGDLINDENFVSYEDIESFIVSNSEKVSPLEALDDWSFA